MLGSLLISTCSFIPQPIYSPKSSLTKNSSMDLDFIDYELANTVTMFINTCIFLSYPINFGIYCGMSRWNLKFWCQSKVIFHI